MTNEIDGTNARAVRVTDYVQPTEDSPICMTCQWRDRTVSESVLTEVKHYLGKSFTGRSYTHRRQTYPLQAADERLGTLGKISS